MVVDMRKLDDATAQRCIEACHRIHNVPDFAQPVNPKDAVSPEEEIRWQVKWIWTDPFHNAFPGAHQEVMSERVHHMNFLLLCNHCDNPPCVQGVSHPGHLQAGRRGGHDGHAPLHRLPVLHGWLPLLGPELQLAGSPALY
jgi:hypothetical protein